MELYLSFCGSFHINIYLTVLNFPKLNLCGVHTRIERDRGGEKIKSSTSFD